MSKEMTVHDKRKLFYKYKKNIIQQRIYFILMRRVPVWLSGRALRQQRKRLWVRFPGNTLTNENV